MTMLAFLKILRYQVVVLFVGMWIVMMEASGLTGVLKVSRGSSPTGERLKRV